MSEPNEKMVNRIQSLLERAGHPGTPEHEREACFEKADQLMAKHRIERAMLNFDRKDKVREIISTAVQFPEGEHAGVMTRILQSVFRHSGCKLAYSFREYTVVGYEEDIFYGEMLWSSIYMDFVRKMYPKWNDEVGFDENVYVIKTAGYSWPQVREMGLAKRAMDRNGPLTAENAGSKLRTAFKRHAKSIGQEVLPGKQQPMTPQLWRDSFAEAFAVRIDQRVYALSEKHAPDGQGAIAIIRDEDRVLQEFYRLFPHLDPEVQKKKEAERRAALTKEERDAEDAYWEKMSRKKAPRMKTRKANMAGWNAGHRAADSVNLNSSDTIASDRQGALG